MEKMDIEKNSKSIKALRVNKEEFIEANREFKELRAKLKKESIMFQHKILKARSPYQAAQYALQG
jgi:hypothetical protein